nr:hypothetical protein CFP56_24129 [Quercus suber]
MCKQWGWHTYCVLLLENGKFVTHKSWKMKIFCCLPLKGCAKGKLKRARVVQDCPYLIQKERLFILCHRNPLLKSIWNKSRVEDFRKLFYKTSCFQAKIGRSTLILMKFQNVVPDKESLVLTGVA